MIGSTTIFLGLTAIVIFGLIVANLEAGLYILLISSVFFHPLDAYQLPIGGSNIRFLDILVVMFLIAWVIRLLFTKEYRTSFKSPANKFLYAVIGILCVFLIIGIIKRRNLITVLRDARAITYYSSAFVIAYIIQNHKQLKKMVKFLIVLSVFSLCYYYLMRALNKPFESGLSTVTLTTESYTRSFGFYSTWPYFAFSFFIIITSLLLNKLQLIRRLALWSLAIAFLFALLLILLRMYFLGLLSGSFLLFFLLWYEGKRTFIVKSLIASSAVIIILFSLYTTSKYNLMHHPIVERYLSIFTPSISTRAAMVTRQDRFEAILYFTRSERNPIFVGEGFGDTVRDLERRHLLWHSSLGWAFYRLGIIPSIVFYLALGGILLRTIIRSQNIMNAELKSIYYGFMCSFLFLLAISSTSGVLFDKVNEMTLVGFILGVFLSLDNIVNNMSEEGKSATEKQPVLTHLARR
ncbi:hypothetical protein H8E77_23995 [bacterium]|nr:hypothetical protein [bacterium]